MAASPQYRLAEIAKHNKEGDLWFIIDRKVYDVSKFADEHPGGPAQLLTVAGADASNGFKAVGHSDSTRELIKEYCIGEVHPDDAATLKESLQGTQSPIVGIAVVGVLIAVTVAAVLHALFF